MKNGEGQVIVHFDREWKDDVIRMDYEWKENDVEYMIEEIPCIDYPFDTHDYLEPYVELGVGFIQHCQLNGSLNQITSFSEIEKNEKLMSELKDLAKKEKENLKGGI